MPSRDWVFAGRKGWVFLRAGRRAIELPQGAGAPSVRHHVGGNGGVRRHHPMGWRLVVVAQLILRHQCAIKIRVGGA
jgi:hypothetical protein